jgi:hypothetical protein
MEAGARECEVVVIGAGFDGRAAAPCRPPQRGGVA